ncbi:type I-D CRISPR-associated helicase Cas3' [Candidatus Cyanaurora vandensis]|uniref:type I-D CRISPR-associated helicase Cas3' n=1 Tax=Candidatus Cyanaurora vandensis TaxID=2714958 RepID=UPI00257ED156|nr:type I-D CRISPR-associated helicase Cas3' [Candidatus Cyanaurora vandensis]
MQIQLLPIYSRLTDELPPGITLPAGWQGLSWHQVETFKALQNYEVVINTAMTGDGKSLAAYLGAVLQDQETLGLYPTNELARDQEQQVRGYIDLFNPRIKPRISRLSGPDLELYAEQEGQKKAVALTTLTGQREILLTNPDIFHYVHRGAYLMRGDSPDKLWQRIDKNFDLFIFDEFHVFSAPQIASVINTLLLMRCLNRPKKFLFLSATPEEQLVSRLEKAGFRCKVIDPLGVGKYCFPRTAEAEAELQGAGWRRVVHGIDLHWEKLEPNNQATEAWLCEHVSQLLTHFLEYPGTKGAIILNSVAMVKRLLPVFREEFAHHGLTVSENTGLTGKTAKNSSLLADLVLGTSTIDVGVDFKINLLVFESADAGNFIQRLGRLGRHSGYERDGERVTFKQFTAYALVPNFLFGRLLEKEDAPLIPGETYERPFFHDQIREQYRKTNNFQGYYRRWGAVQSVILDHRLNHITVREQFALSRAAFAQACETVFETDLKKVRGCVYRWGKEWEELSGRKGNPIADEAASFRGTSPLQCAIYDVTEPDGADRFKTYDLPGILGNLHIEMMSEAFFLRLLKDASGRTGQPIAQGRFKHCFSFMKLVAYREERLDWHFIHPGDLIALARNGRVQVLRDFKIRQPDNPWCQEINERLRKEGLVCYILSRPMGEIRNRLQLPMHFQIYSLSDEHSHRDKPFSVAFGQSALLLETLAYRLKEVKGEMLWIV